VTEVLSAQGQSIWAPNPRQDVALRCPAFELLYGGTKGGGKSDFLVVCDYDQIALAEAQYRLTGRKQRGRSVLFRKNLRNLEDLIQRSKEIYPEIDPGAEWNKNDKRWTLSSGYRAEFAHLDGPDDHQAYQGQEITSAKFDQGEEIPFETYQFIVAQVRSKDPDMRQLLKVRVTANPGGKYGDWIKSYFIDKCPPNRIVTEEMELRGGKKRATTKAFVPATLWDNPYLADDGVYESNLRKLPEHMQRMYLDGDWNVVVGAYFSHVWRKDIHVCRSFPISGAWEVKMGLDWGSTAPACVLWGARDNDDTVYIIDELYGPGHTGRRFGERVVKKFQDQQWSAERKWALDDVYGLVDYHAFSKHGAEGMSPGAGIMSWGVRLFDAIKDRAAGNEQVLERLLPRANGKPRLVIFEDRCPNLVRSLPNLRGSQKDPNDVDTDQDDHAYDALKYLLLDWPIRGDDKRNKQDADVERWMRIIRSRDRQREVDSHMQTGYE